MINRVYNLLSQLQDTPIFIYDTETTGLSPENCDIIQFSALRCQVRKEPGANRFRFLTDDTIDIYINPGYSIPEYITRINGISDQTILEKGFSGKSASEMIRDFLGDQPVMAGYNSVAFDRRFVDKLFLLDLGVPFVPREEIDVLRLARSMIPKFQVGGSYRLENVAGFFGVDEGFQFHSAIDDARVTLLVLEKLINCFEAKNIF